MPKNEEPGEGADWNLMTWDGSRREALRRWAKLPLEQVIAALEEMHELSDMLAKPRAAGEAESPPPAEGVVHEPRRGYNAATATQAVAPQEPAPVGHRGARRSEEKGGDEG